jgi:hypothetical protein
MQKVEDTLNSSGGLRILVRTLLTCPRKVPWKFTDISVQYIEFDILTNDWYGVHRVGGPDGKLAGVGNVE